MPNWENGIIQSSRKYHGNCKGYFGTAPKPFCTNCGNTVTEQAVACMSCGARPIGHKKFCRQCGVGLNPEQIMCIKCGAGLCTAPSRSGTVDNVSSQAKKINIYFMVYWICLAATLLFLGVQIVCVLGAQNFIEHHGGIPEGMRVLLGFSTMLLTLVMLAGTISGCMLHYQLWKLIPTHIARTTPGKAVGFMFIPLFNFYWCFVSLLGLSKDLKEALRQRGIQYQISEGIPIFCCVLFILSQLCINPSMELQFSLIDLLGMVIGLIGAVLAFLFYYSCKNGAIALLEQEGA